MKSNKGITLIALIITIIVLLILAGITISTITSNDSAISKALEAKTKTEAGEIVDALRFALVKLKTEFYTGDVIKDINSVYESKENFEVATNWDDNVYPIESYEFNSEDNKVTLEISKRNGVGVKHQFEIDTENYQAKWINSDGTSGGGSATITHNIAYYGTDQSPFANLPKQYTEGEETYIGIPADVAGRSFEGWYKTSDYTGSRVTTISSEENEDITLYPKWLSESNNGYFKYSVSGTNATITGLTTEGATAYNNNAEDIINLVIPRKDPNGNSVVAIGDIAFSGKNKCKSLVIHDGITSINNQAFYNWTGLKNLTIPISLDTTNARFYNCKNLESVIFTVGSKNGVTASNREDTPWYYSSNASNGNHSVTIEFKEGIESIANKQFYGCTNIHVKSFPSTLKTIGDRAFYNTTNMTEELKIGSNLTTIGAYTFTSSGISGKLTLPATLTSIGTYAFSGCTNIESVEINNERTSIADDIFRDCTGIKTLKLPISLNVTSNRFLNCTGITKVILTPGTTGAGANGTSSGSGPWFYSSNSGKGNHAIEVELQEGIESIGQYMFYNCTNLKMVTLPSTLKTIGERAFSNTTNMTGKLEFPTSVTSLGNFCFTGSGVTEVTIPANLSGSCYYGFSSSLLEKVVIADGVTSLQNCTFRSCSHLKELTIPISLYAIGGNGGLFFDTKNIEKITFTPGSGTGYSGYSTNSSAEAYYRNTPWYSNNNNTVNIIFKKGITSLGANMFKAYSNQTPEHFVFTFEGTAAEWEQISIPSGNDRITTEGVTCTGT